jgi:hypothetical protein
MTNTFCLLVTIVLIIFYIIDFKYAESFKNELIYEQKYLNDPNKIIKYMSDRENRENRENRESKKNGRKNDSLTSVNKIQSNNVNNIYPILTEKIKSNNGISKKHKEPKGPNYDIYLKNSEIEQNEKIKFDLLHSTISGGQLYRNSTTISCQKNPNLQKVNFKLVAQNPESKYKLYHDSLFTPNPAPKLYSENKPIIDQTISINIMDYANKGKQSVPIDYANPSNVKVEDKNLNTINTRGKTIKDIYDEITQDGRLDLQKNLDDLQAFNNRNDYVLGEKYGTTRFDTYAIG